MYYLPSILDHIFTGMNDNVIYRIDPDKPEPNSPYINQSPGPIGPYDQYRLFPTGRSAVRSL